MSKKKHRRVRWRVRRCSSGWLPVVLIGEEPMTLACQAEKHLAREIARTRAEELREAGLSY